MTGPTEEFRKRSKDSAVEPLREWTDLKQELSQNPHWTGTIQKAYRNYLLNRLETATGQERVDILMQCHLLDHLRAELRKPKRKPRGNYMRDWDDCDCQSR
jgi:hypothetical protein